MELGLSRDEVLQTWDTTLAMLREPGAQAEARMHVTYGENAGVVFPEGTPDWEAALLTFVNNVVRLNNRRIQEQLEKAGIKLE
jgi:hypothetical protein